LRPAQKLRLAGKVASVRDSLDARREALVNLSDLAAELLRDAGSNPSLDTLRRVTTTLEALSAHALHSDGPTPGRLTQDLDPPSFDSLASLMSGAAATEEIDEPIAPARKTGANVRRLEEARRAKIADAKVTLQDAKKSLSEARARVQSLESAQKKANAEVQEARLNELLANPWRRLTVKDESFSVSDAGYAKALKDLRANSDTRWSPWRMIDGDDEARAALSALSAIADAWAEAMPAEPPHLVGKPTRAA